MYEFCKVLNCARASMTFLLRNAHGMGGKWSDLQQAREGQYFHKRNQAILKFLQLELKKGRKIEDVLEEVKQKLKEPQAVWDEEQDDKTQKK